MEANFKYLSVINYLKELINTGRLRENDKLPTEIELTQIFGVSRITVQKAFLELIREGIVYRNRGRGTFVSKVSSGGYTYKEKEKSGKLKFIGAVLPVDKGWGISYSVIQGIQEYAKKKDCYVTVHNSMQNPEEEEKIIRQLVDNGACGIILMCVNMYSNLKLYRELLDKKFPLVFVDRCPKYLKVDFVGSDNYMGAYKLVNYLINLGHRKIALVANENETMTTVKERLNGYCDALIDNGIPICEKYMRIRDDNPDYDLKLIENFVEKLLGMEDPPTAIFALNDFIAITCLNKIIKMGYSVPENVSVVGFDSIFKAEHMLVSLTTVEQPLQEMGMMAGRLLFRRLRHSTNCFNQLYLPVNIVTGQSTDVCRMNLKK